MRRNFAALVFAAAGFLAPNAARPAEPDSVATLAASYWDAVMQRYPTRATESGDHRFDDKLEDLSEPARRRWQGTLQGFLTKLRSIPKASESAEQRLNRTLLKRALRDSLTSLACLGHYMPLDPLDGAHIRFPLILVSQPFHDRHDFENYIQRLQAFPVQVAQMIQNMRRGQSIGLVAPRVVVERVIPQIRRHIVADVTRSEFYAPVKQLDLLDEAARPAMRDGIVSAIRGFVIPGYLRLLAYVEDEALPQSRATIGISGVPNGDKIYNALAFLNMTVPIPVDEIHQLGLSEVARIRTEMATVKTAIGFDGGLDDFLVKMRNDPARRFASREDMLAAADRILQRTRKSVGKLFGRLPQSDIVMKEIEAFRAASSPMAYYGPVPEDGSRPAYFYINTYKPQDRMRFTLEALAYHESIPGHHLQIALAVENEDLPRFRRFYGNFTAYVEGWALYAEKLGYELGGYTDPYQQFGQLTLEMWRACRLVVDTGIHVKGWSRRQAIDFMIHKTCLSRLDIEAEVDRYIVWPGQALAYKVGELRILALRKEAEQALGERFSLPDFHDALLADGPMPIDLLEQRMRTWIHDSTHQS